MDKNANNNQTKTQLSLAALMFFSPLVQNMINKDNLEISNDEKKFIKGYIRLGYISITMLAITILAGVINYNLELGITNRLYTISIIILTIILTIGTIGILTDTNILAGDKGLIDLYYEHITTDKKEILMSYLPIYNIYSRYKTHNFEKPNLLIKESIIAWIIFIILGLTTTPFWTSTMLIVIIIRVASLMGGLDIVNTQTKKFINGLFTKNPEELRGYIRGSVIYLFKKLTDQTDNTSVLQREKIAYFVDREKTEFSLLYNIQLDNSIVIKTQYIIAIIASILLVRQSNIDLNQRIIVLPLIIIVGRYLVMAFSWQHLPSLPIYKEITDLLFYTYQRIKDHFTNK